MNKKARMKELVALLNEASKSYYAEDTELLSNLEYDELYEELTLLEEEMGTVLANSPTVMVGFEAVDELPKEKHDSPMLSLAKTKNRDELRAWLQGKVALLSWKLDGLTIVLSYSEGKLAKAVTRGNGEIGEVITNNAKTFVNLPLTIPFKGELILRGEAVITYSDFAKINEKIEDVESKYKNPRNLCSGSVRQLNNEVTAARSVKFFAFSMVKADSLVLENSRNAQFAFLQEQGFEVVEHELVTEDTILDVIDSFEKKIETFDIPSDGLVLSFDDINFGVSLGRTAKFPRDSIAFKWKDEKRETILKEIEWSPSRTGLINPVAIFESVELEGTTVSRASVHNISIMRALELGIGDRITVYKANMIIPQIAENLTRSGLLDIPTQCPVCGEPVGIKKQNEVEVLFCENPDCDVKKVKSFTLFVSRDAMNIDGLSEATLEKLIAKGFLHQLADIYQLERYKDEIVTMEGFGEKSYQNLIKNIEISKHTTLPRLIYGLGIAGIGVANAKMICKVYQHDLLAIRNADAEELSQVDGFGEVLAQGMATYFRDEKRKEALDLLLKHLEIEQVEVVSQNQTLEGKVFVITGSVTHYENRDQLKEEIELLGGKVTGSVTSKTDYLINNDVTSSSGKNKKAKELGVPIISEEEYMAMK